MSILNQRLAANLSFLFTEWPFLDRFAAAADAGFTAVEFLFPYNFGADAIADRLAANHLSVSVFNAPPGNWEAGERGLAALPDRVEAFRGTIPTALTYAKALNAGRVHVLAGLAEAGDPRARAVYRDNLAFAADLANDSQVQILIEPINSQDVPGYFLQDFSTAQELVTSFAAGRLGLQFDVYHCQKINNEVLPWLAAQLPIISHMQIAGVPGRHEPAEPALPLSALFALLDREGYGGRVGCEYHPARGTLEGLAWIDTVEAAQT